MEALYEEGQSLIKRHWPEPNDREAQKQYRNWERLTADYLEEKLGKSYKVQYRDGQTLAQSALNVLLSPTRLRERIDGSLERLGEIIWGLRGPDAPVASQSRMDGHSYVLVFHNRTGESRVFTAQASLQGRRSVRGIRGGMSYHPGWQGTGSNEIEIAHGEVANLVLGRREVLGSGDSQQIRLRFPWTTQEGETTDAVTELWTRGNKKPFRFKIRVVIAAKPAYDGSPFSACYRLEPFSFGSTPC